MLQLSPPFSPVSFPFHTETTVVCENGHRVCRCASVYVCVYTQIKGCWAIFTWFHACGVVRVYVHLDEGVNVLFVPRKGTKMRNSRRASARCRGFCIQGRRTLLIIEIGFLLLLPHNCGLMCRGR